MLKTRKDQIFISVIFLAVLFAAFGGAVIGANYASCVSNLAFLPDFLKPKNSLVQQTTGDENKTIRVVEESGVIDVVDKASPAVVSIVAQTVSLDPTKGITRDQQGIGTGFIVRNDGIILTASHVVSDSSITYNIVTKDEKTFTVKKIDFDTSIDFAILKVDAKDLPTLQLSDSDAVKVGQKVVAIGNALGRFGNSVTVGVISGVGRGVTAANSIGLSESTQENVIQTDAALNPGNSGGPLLDLSAKVVGINFATTIGAENIGFVIPINNVNLVLAQYYAKGRIIRPYLGIAYVVVDQTTSVLQKIPEGVFIEKVVANTPASQACLQQGDIITKFGGISLKGGITLAGVIGKFKVGEKVDLEVWRDGKELKLKATLT